MRRILALSVVVAAMIAGTAVAGQFKIGYCCNNFNDTFQTYIVDSAKKAAVAAKVDLEIMDAQEDVVRQQDQVNTLLQNGVNALIVVPVNTSAVQPIIKSAQDAKTPLIFVNRNPFSQSAPPPGAYYLGADATLEGKTQMEAAGKALGGKGNICILIGMLSNEGAVARTQGIKDVIKEKYPNIKILAEETGNWQRDQGLNITENWLTAYGDSINAVLGNNDEMALGALQALTNAGKRNVLTFGVDAISDALTAIEQGKMTATVLQDPVAQGKGSVDLAIDILNGKKPEQIKLMEALLIDKTNIAQHKK